MSVDVLPNDLDDSHSDGCGGNGSGNALEILADFSDDFQHFPWLTSAWCVISWLRDTILLHNFSESLVDGNNLCGRRR